MLLAVSLFMILGANYVQVTQLNIQSGWSRTCSVSLYRRIHDLSGVLADNQALKAVWLLLSASQNSTNIHLFSSSGISCLSHLRGQITHIFPLYYLFYFVMQVTHKDADKNDNMKWRKRCWRGVTWLFQFTNGLIGLKLLCQMTWSWIELVRYRDMLKLKCISVEQ